MANDIKQTVFIEASLTQIQGQLKTLEGNFHGTFESIKASAATAVGAMGIGFSVGALVAFGKSVADMGAELQDLNKQTGVSVEALSGIKPLLDRTGSSIDSFARGVFNLQKNLGNVDVNNDTDKVGEAVKRLGLNLDDLRNSSPDEFIKKVTDSLVQITNPTERNTVLFNLLGKSSRELAPAFSELAGKFDELRSKGLSAETVTALADISHGFSDAKNVLLNFSAQPTVDTFSGLKEILTALRGTVEALLLSTEKSANSFLSWKNFVDFATFSTLGFYKIGLEVLRLAPQLADALTLGAVGFSSAWDKAIAGVQGQQDKILAAILSRSAKIGANIGAGMASLVPKAPGQFPGKIDDSALKALNSFMEGLQKQADAMRVSIVEMSQGALAAKDLGLDLEFAAFKAKLLADGKVVPPDSAAKFEKAKADVLSYAEGLAHAKLDADLLKKSLEEMDKAFPEPLMPGEVQLPAVLTGGIMSEEEFNSQKAKLKELNDLRVSLAIGAMDTSTPQGAETKRTTQIEADFANTATKIMEMGQALGLSQEQIAADVGLAWDKALAEIGNKAGEMTEFFRKAAEEIQSAVAGGINDLLSGNIKSWSEWGQSIKSIIDRVVSQFLAAQLNFALFGPNVAQGQIGGWAGSLFGSLSGGGWGSAPAGVEGPLMQGGGFFSNVFGALGFHEGGVVGESGHPVRFGDVSMFAAARRYAKGTNFLLPNEVPIIAHVGEKITPAGKNAGGGSGGDIYNFTFNGVENIDSFRRSRPQLLADLARAVERGKKHL